MKVNLISSTMLVDSISHRFFVFPETFIKIYIIIEKWFLFTCFRVRVQKLFLSSRPLLVRQSVVAYGGTQFSELIGHCR